MLEHIVALVLAAVFPIPTGSAVGTAPSEPPRDKKAPLTLTGCVSRSGTTPSSFTIADAATGNKYRLSGVSVRKYAGQRVVIIGGPERRLTIRGGLVPSPNAAAQAGYQDPVQAAVANLPGGPNSGTGDAQLPTVRVTRVRPAGGSCE
jgi:hypothetical protein